MRRTYQTTQRLILPAVLAGMLILFGGAAKATAAPIVSPNANTAVEGNSNNGFPFNIALFGLSSQRYQQVYNSSQFPSGQFLITQIAFRPDDSSGNPFVSILGNVQINLSTTSAAEGTLSTTFASNVGGDDTVVFSGPLALSSAAVGGPPRNFDIVINLTTPFLYNTANGNLLLDVRNFSGGSTTQFDFSFVGGDGVSRVFTLGVNGVNSPTGTDDTGGLVTRFNLEPVPEPTSLVVFGVMAVSAGFFGYRRRKQVVMA